MRRYHYVFLALCSFQIMVQASQDGLAESQASLVKISERQIDEEHLLKVPTKESEREKIEIDKKTTDLAVCVARLLKKLEIPRWKFCAELATVQNRMELAEQVQEEERAQQFLSRQIFQTNRPHMGLMNRPGSPRPLQRVRSAEDGLTRDTFSPADLSSSTSSPTQFSSIKEESEEERKRYETDL